LEEANLLDADLTGASLLKANLKGAILKGAKLDRTDVNGADFTNAIDLTIKQIESAINFQKAIFPAHIQEALANRERTKSAV